MQINIGSLFSGAIDGMTMGFKMASDSYNPIISNELENTAVKTLMYNYDHKIIQDDVRNVSVDLYRDCQVLLGTFPCQEYSKAAAINRGKRAENWKQAYHWASIRDLFLHFFRFVAIIQPEVYIWENSPEVRNFPIVMETFRKLPPYNYYELELDTQDFNLPQRRKRLFVVGFKREYNMPSPYNYMIHKRQLTIGDIREQDVNIVIPDYVKNRINGMYRDTPSIKKDTDIANTAVAHYGKDMSTTMILDPNGYKGLRPFTVTEYARAQGIHDSFVFKNARSTNYKHIGNSVSPVVTYALAKAILGYFKQYSIDV